ncbi:MAG: single-stranded DNA-binding protein [Fusobacteriaceae bacterium]|uniref:single-stranded DNA-binding protein n=1 Tax=Romboutsia sp. TaxID=1965302 RepID=UPI003F38A43B
MNQVILVGRLTRDPELRYIAGSGTPVAQFAIAVDREFSGKDGKKETDFIDIQVWNKVAESCANYLTKGSLVAIQGSLRIETYQNQAGENRRAARVNASRVQFLDNRNKSESTNTFVPGAGLDANEFEAINDPDIPF